MTVMSLVFYHVLQDKDKHGPRRWSSNQVKEFGPLHGTLSLLVRNTDISMFESESAEGSEVVIENPYRIPGSHSDLRPPPDSMHQALFSIEHSKRLIHEVRLPSQWCHLHFHLTILPTLPTLPTLPQCVLTLRECDPAATEAIAATFCYCCWNNQSFSACAIEDLQASTKHTT